MKLCLIGLTFIFSVSSFAGDSFTVDLTKFKKVDIVDVYETPVKYVSFVEDFDGKVIKIDDQRDIPLKNLETIAGMGLNFIDRAIVSNNVAAALVGGDGGGGVHRVLNGSRSPQVIFNPGENPWAPAQPRTVSDIFFGNNTPSITPNETPAITESVDWGSMVREAQGGSTTFGRDF